MYVPCPSFKIPYRTFRHHRLKTQPESTITSLLQRVCAVVYAHVPRGLCACAAGVPRAAVIAVTRMPAANKQ